MAVINKQWSNGDALTLTTSAGGIAVASAQNLTGADRQTTVTVQTTNPGTKKSQVVTINQAKQPDTRGWWVHYQTGVKTFFDATADFIDANGVMSKPSWVEDAKEIRLCAGITDFIHYSITLKYGSYYTPQSHSGGEYLLYGVTPFANNLEKFDFGDASAPTAYLGMFSGLPKLSDVIFNSAVTKLEPAFYAAGNTNVLKRITIPSSVTAIENGCLDLSGFGGTGIFDVLVFGGQTGIETIYTDVGNTTALQALLNGKGLPSGYQIIEQ